MVIKIEDQTYTLPASLLEITLRQRIDYEAQYGKALQERLAQIIDMPEGIDRELATLEYQGELACKTLSFFGNIPIEVVENTDIYDVLFFYQQTMAAVSADQNFSDEEKALQLDFEWESEQWTIQEPALKNSSAMCFGEFLDAKQWVKNLYELGENKWEALLMLACVYFRKKDEAYQEEFTEEGGDRYQLLETMPLDYALQVGFFLSASINFYLRTFPSSNPEEAPASLK